jgi:DNA-binding beta-propeller fold protein YncE
LNHQAPSATAPSRRPAGAARLAASLRVGGSGAPSSGRVWARTPSLRLVALLALATGILLSFTASPASAAITHEFLFKIGEVPASSGAALTGPIEQPQALTVDSGALYVADHGYQEGRIDKFDAATGAWLSQFELVPSPTFLRQGIAVGHSTGETEVYVGGDKAGTTEGVVAVFGPTGSLQNVWTGADTPAGAFACFECAGPTDVAVDESSNALTAGRVYVADRAHNVIDAFEPKPGGGEKYLTQISEAEGEPLEEPFGVAVDQQTGEVVVLDHRAIEIFEPTGPTTYERVARITETSEGPLRAQGIDVDGGNGDIYVAESFPRVISQFDSSGNYLGRINKGPEGPLGEVRLSLAVDPATHDVYVGDLSAGKEFIDVFGPSLVIPDVATQPATAVTTTSATLHGEVNPAGLEVEECSFEYGETTAYGQVAPCEESSSAIGEGNAFVPVEVKLENLNPGSEYHFRLAAKNENGTNAESGDQSFFTGASVDSTSVSDVSSTAATLETELNPHGLPTSFHFEYVTQQQFETSGFSEPIQTPTASVGSGNEDVFRSVQLQGLQPLTAYRYRVVAENSLGIVEAASAAFTTQGPGSALLPDDRGWELVTPPQKFGSPLVPLQDGGALLQAAANGSAFASSALGPLGPDAAGNRSPAVSQWLSARGPGGWSTQDVTTPHEEISQVSEGSEYKLFANDLSAGLVEPIGATPLSPQTTERTPYRREANGEFAPLIVGCPAEPQPCPPAIAARANVPPGTEFGGVELFLGGGIWGLGVEIESATTDLAHVVLQSRQLLTEEFEPAFEASETLNLYELSGGALRLLSVLPSGEATSEAGLFMEFVSESGLNRRGAISSDGSRVLFQAREPNSDNRHLYLRDNATQPQSAIDGSGHCTEPAKACTIQLDALQQGAAGGPDEPTFQAASADGARVFFTDRSRLTADASTSGDDLYMCEIVLGGDDEPECALSDLSANHAHPGEATKVVKKVSAIDASGAHVYFAAAGALTDTPNARGEHAIPSTCNFQEAASTCNLYVYDTTARQVSLVAVLSGADAPDWGGAVHGFLGNLTARSSPNGRWFTFMSQRNLTGYDNRDALSGQPDQEVYLYDSATGALHCASCNPTGARPHGVANQNPFPGLLVDHPHTWGDGGAGTKTLAASIPGWTNIIGDLPLYQSRYLSDSGRLFFTAADALVPSDTNGVMDVYQYEPPGVGGCTESSPTFGPASGGCVDLISSGTSPEESAFLDASESGNDVFFLTQSRLTSKDVDNAFDVYDASVGGGEAQAVNPPACEGDACQPPATPPADPTPGSLTFNGAGNVQPSRKHHKKHHRKKHHKRSHKRAANNHRRAGR